MKFVSHLKILSSLLACTLFLACGSDKDSNEKMTAEQGAADHHMGHEGHEGHGDHQHAQPSDESLHGLFQAKIEWAAAPVAGQAINEATVSFFNPEGEAIEAELKGFHPWMPAHGHGSIESAIQWQPASGPAQSFAVSGIFFSMAGEWVIRLVVDIGGASDEITIPVAQEVK
ncbi:MAG: hypothetical protein ACOH5I_10250 [Oligoflexus sp.]